MRVYRISKPAYVVNALSGQGAGLYPGRWNSIGVRLAYAAGSVALSMLEMLVHVDKEDVPIGRRLLSYELPDDGVLELRHLPSGWSDLPYSIAVQQTGDQWLASAASLALRVPSAVARHEFNLLINPAHPRFDEVALVANEALALDERLFR
ncbi:RES family NAD+ phosphorylase [Variovorax sp. J31P179]|jgi:RES domain-containing protein|uniref:RES family NAD+ phosphorylase n=1 Tax=Variovorax sp. J31P179 TaxID=3053508 RepID=UPI002576B830|nr:RES family NAD+ phosphorylase [Variovorax sp. J31P179]MDM0081312.1 RES family NAD+ phosphorylase [Variovorax sp. J31P179]